MVEPVVSLLGVKLTLIGEVRMAVMEETVAIFG
jgi:hypothetical protein